jgi:hypothetical protein
MVLLQEIRSDLTEAEFALRLSEISKAKGSQGKGTDLETEAASINLPRLYERLSAGIDRLSAGGFEFAGQSSDEIDALLKRIEDVQYGLGKVATECSLPGGGGVDACDAIETSDVELAETVKKRIKRLRSSIRRSFATRIEPSADALEALETQISADTNTLAEPEADKKEDSADGTAVFIRKDGTVDWDAAMESGREVARFGNDLWDRVNGVDEEGMISAEKQRQEFLQTPVAQAVLVEIRAIGTEIAEAEKVWRETSKKAGLRVADAEPAKLADLRLKKLILETDLSMEIVALYIEKEIGQVAVSDDMKYLIAEFGLLDSQVQQIVNSMKSGKEIVELEVYVIAEDVQQLVKRLGLLELAPFQISWTVVQLSIQQTVTKFQSGCAFVGTGIKMLGSDCWYTLSLFGQAIKGTVLTPREVRCVRRNLKDLLTLIPYTIILAIPLSPVGHVLVFNILQRLFPGFCPSTFTERRQNLATLYDAVRIPDEPENDGWFVRKPSGPPVPSVPGGREIPKFRFTDKKAGFKWRINFPETQLPGSGK